jgi:lipopolysaccharide/colanic/teichoic acid biosynthesis glycosyltransferase
LLSKSSNPEETYITEVMPQKLALNRTYIKEQSFLLDLKIICNTILKIVK